MAPFLVENLMNAFIRIYINVLSNLLFIFRKIGTRIYKSRCKKKD